MKILPSNISTDPYLGKGIEFFFYFAIFAVALIISGSWLFWFNPEELSAIGSIGAFIGGILGPLFALLVAIFTFLAFYVQYDANKKIQEQFRIQQFENKFYKMLDMHKQNVAEMNISFFDNKLITTPNGKENEEFLREVRGRKIFVGMVPELESCILIVKLECQKLGFEIKENQLRNYSYRLFFYGKYSEQTKLDHIPVELHKAVLEEFEIQQTGFYHRNFHQTIKFESFFRFFPFEGHESRLGHYYRHLYAMVKMVVENETTAKKKGLFNFDESLNYLKMIRAQLSNAEQTLLYYNYICGFGKDWDKLGGKGNQFLTKYKMIHNIPVDRIKVVENPRLHFRDFICNHCTEKEELFEWGDNREKLNCE